MFDEVLAPGAVQQSCLLQRAFALDGNALVTGSQSTTLEGSSLLSESLSGSQSWAKASSNILLGGSAPWELHHGIATDPHGHRSGMLPMLAVVPHYMEFLVTGVLVVAILAYVFLGRSQHSQQSAKMKGLGICSHIVVISISGFLRGYSLYIIGPLLMPIQRSLQLCYPCAAGESDLALASCSCPWKEFAVSSVALGAIFGCLLGGVMADAVGRRLTLIFSDLLFIISSLMMAMSGPESWASIFFVGRVLSGLAVGTSGPASHAYISEIVPPRYRGQILTSLELSQIVGVFTVFGFSALVGDESWRDTIQFPALPAAVQLCCMLLFLQESPRWLAANGRTEEAQRVLDALGLESACSEPSKTSMVKNRKALINEKRQRSGLAILMQHRRRVGLAIGCALAHNALGANIVMYYSRDILQLASIANSAGSQMSLGGAKAIGTLIAFTVVDRCGRRFLIVVGTIGAILGHVGLAWSFLPSAVQIAPALAWSSLLLFLAAWDLGWASLMSVVISEVLPDDVRGLGLGISCSLFWLSSFVQAQTLETLFKQITIPGTFAMYGIISIIGLLWVLKYVPETCGRPLEVE